MANKELKENILGWLQLDNDIKSLQKQIKEKRKEKKESTQELVSIMRDNEIDCFDLDSTGGKLIYTQQKVKQSLSKKYLLSCLTKYYENDSDQAKKMSEFILNSSEEKIKENIKRKVKK